MSMATPWTRCSNWELAATRAEVRPSQLAAWVGSETGETLPRDSRRLTERLQRTGAPCLLLYLSVLRFAPSAEAQGRSAPTNELTSKISRHRMAQWTPISSADFESLLRKELDQCQPEERALFESTKVPVERRPMKDTRYLDSAYVVASYREETCTTTISRAGSTPPRLTPRERSRSTGATSPAFRARCIGGCTPTGTRKIPPELRYVVHRSGETVAPCLLLYSSVPRVSRRPLKRRDVRHRDHRS